MKTGAKQAVPVLIGFDSRTRRHMWVEFIVVLASKVFFPGFLVFQAPQKQTLLHKSNLLTLTFANSLLVRRDIYKRLSPDNLKCL